MQGSGSAEKIIFGYQFPLSHPTAITVIRVKKGKKKGELESLNFISVTEARSFDFKILTNEEDTIKIVEILENFPE